MQEYFREDHLVVLPDCEKQRRQRIKDRLETQFQIWENHDQHSKNYGPVLRRGS